MTIEKVEIRKQLTFDRKAELKHLPSLDWHLANITQLINKLAALNAPKYRFFAACLDQISNRYTLFINSYDKRERLDRLIDIIHYCKAIANTVELESWEAYKTLAIETWDYQTKQAKTIGQEYTPFDKYCGECISYCLALHDFALGMAAVAKYTNTEPEKALYNNLEKNAI